MWATRAMIYTTLQATSMQLVFGRDAILNIKFQANWKYTEKKKQRKSYLRTTNEKIRNK
jgi:hypothetical protein